MKITQVRVLAMSDPVPMESRHRTDLGTKIKSDSAIIFVDSDTGLTGMGAALGNPGVLQAIVEYELSPEVMGEDPMFSERIYEKLYNGSRARPAMDTGWSQPDPSRRRGMVMEAIAGIDIAIWDLKAQALGVPVYQALGATRDRVRAYGSGGWAPGDEAEAELGGYADKGFSAVKMRVVGRDGFSIENTVRRVKAARRGIGPDVELMIDAHGSLDVSTSIRLAKALEAYDIAWFEEPVSPAAPGTSPGAAGDIHSDCLGRAGIYAVRLSGPLGARRPRHRAARRGALWGVYGDPAHGRPDLGPSGAAGAARLGQRSAVCGVDPRCHGRRQLPYSGGQPGLHADDLGSVQRVL